jgi:hypothetical protein
MRRCALVLCAFAAFAASAADESGSDTIASAGIALKLTADVKDARGKLIPADRVGPGDEVFYTLEIRNTRSIASPPPRIDYPIPEHMRYVADSAAGPGAEVSYSVDGGHTFGRPDNLRVTAPSGQERTATAADYTHIRWQLKHALKGSAIAIARFRAVVK